MIGVPGGHPPPPAPPGGPCESRTAETEAFMTDNIMKRKKKRSVTTYVPGDDEEYGICEAKSLFISQDFPDIITSSFFIT